MKRRMMFILLLLIGGAIVNVAVVWSIAYRSDSRYKTLDQQLFDKVVDYSTLYPTDVPRPHFREVRTGFGVRHEFLFSVKVEEPYEKWLDTRALIEHVGWPCAAMRSFYFFHESETGIVRETSLFERGIDVDDWLTPDPVLSCFGRASSPPRFLALRPILPGFVINTLTYSLLLWPFLAAPLAARRMLRCRRGQCARCAYPIGTSPVCTECGAAVAGDMARRADP